MAAGNHKPSHSSRPVPRPNRIVAGVGITAALAAVVLGTVALIRYPGSTPSSPRSLQAITVTSPPGAVVPLSGPEILALLDRSPELGPLANPQRRASCLAGLGYPASTQVLGARRIEINGHPGVLLVLPGEQAGSVAALAVEPNCNSADTGLIADTTVRRP